MPIESYGSTTSGLDGSRSSTGGSSPAFTIAASIGASLYICAQPAAPASIDSASAGSTLRVTVNIIATPFRVGGPAPGLPDEIAGGLPQPHPPGKRTTDRLVSG